MSVLIWQFSIGCCSSNGAPSDARASQEAIVFSRKTKLSCPGGPYFKQSLTRSILPLPPSQKPRNPKETAI